MSRKKELLKGSIVISFGTFLPKLATFVITPLLTGYLTKEEYGSYDLIIVLASLIIPVATLQIQAAAFRYLIECRGDEDRARQIISNIFLTVSVPSVITLIFVFFLFPSADVVLKLCICLYFFMDALYGFLGQVARGLGNNLAYSLGAIINAASNVILLSVLLVGFSAGLTGATLSLLTSYFVASVFLAVRIRLFRYLRFDSIDRALIKEMLSYSWPMVPNAMSMWVMRASDRFVILLAMGVSWNAVYAAANKIPSILTLAQNAFSMAWQENASVSVNDENVGSYYSAMFSSFFRLLSGFMAFLIGVSPLLFKILIRGDYGEAYKQIPILLLGMLFFGLSSFLGGIYIAFKKTKSVGITTFISAIINLVVDLALIRFIGLYAASGSTLISYIFLFVYRAVDIRKFISVRFDLRLIMMIFAVLLLQTGIYYFEMPLMQVINAVIGTACLLLYNLQLIRRLGGAVLKKIGARG